MDKQKFFKVVSYGIIFMSGFFLGDIYRRKTHRKNTKYVGDIQIIGEESYLTINVEPGNLKDSTDAVFKVKVTK